MHGDKTQESSLENDDGEDRDQGFALSRSTSISHGGEKDLEEQERSRTASFDIRLRKRAGAFDSLSAVRSVRHRGDEFKSAEDNGHAQVAGSVRNAFLKLNEEGLPRQRTLYGAKRKGEELGIQTRPPRWRQLTLSAGEGRHKFRDAMVVEESDDHPQSAGPEASARSWRSDWKHPRWRT